MQFLLIVILIVCLISLIWGIVGIIKGNNIMQSIVITLGALIIGVPILLNIGIAFVSSSVGDDGDWLGFWGGYIGSIIGVFGSGITAYLIFNYQQRVMDEKELEQKKFEQRPNLVPINSSVNLLHDKNRETFLSFEYATFLMRDAEYPMLQDIAKISKHHIVETNKHFYLLRGIILNSKNNNSHVYRNIRIKVSFKKDESKVFYIQRAKSDQILVLEFLLDNIQPIVNPEILEIDIYLETLYENLWIKRNEDGTNATYLVDNKDANPKLTPLELEGDGGKKSSKELDASFSKFIEDYEKLRKDGKTNKGYYRYDLIVSVM